MDSRNLRRRTAAAVLAASCAIAPAVATVATVAIVAPASATTGGVAPAPSAAPVNTKAPSIASYNSWSYPVGEPAVVDVGEWDTGGLTFTYHWQIGGSDISGATGDSYTPVIADIDKALTVVVTASNGTETSAPATSAAVTVDKGDIHYVTLPKVTGDPKVGSVLTADPGTTDVATATATVQWYVGDDAVPGATSLTYLVRAVDLGLPVSFFVAFEEPNYYMSFAPSDSVTVGQGTLTNLAEPAVAGAAVVGKTLTITPGRWSSTDGVALTHRWTVGGAPVAGATGSTFVVPASAAGKPISVVETAGGTAAWTVATSVSAAVTATKAPAKVVLRLASPAKGKVTVKVVVTSTVAATGKVTVLVGKVQRTVALKNGKATLTVAKLKKGKTRVTASYAGATGVAAARKAGSVRVK